MKLDIAKIVPERKRLKRSTYRMKLEPRLLFDGAIVDTAIELENQSDEPEIQSQHGIFVNEQTGSTVIPENVATSIAARIQNWINDDKFESQARQVFSGSQNSDQALERIAELKQLIAQDDFQLNIKLLDAKTLDNNYAAFSTEYGQHDFTIFINQEWLSTAPDEAVERVLLEEIGHAFDNFILNGQDSAGDEGHNFAGLLLFGEDNYLESQSEFDLAVIDVDGTLVSVEYAGPYDVIQLNYVPMDEANLETVLTTLYPAGTPIGVISNTIGLSALNNNTVIVYDHWEDGYETDIKNPLQVTTEIWGDGDLSNGTAPGTSDDIILPGQIIELQNDVDPLVPVANDYDGKDKIGSTGPITVSRAFWDTGMSYSIAGAVAVSSSTQGGDNFILPIGEDMSGIAASMFEYVGAHITAFTDGTNLSIDLDGDGSDDVNVVINEGESYLVNGGLQTGATIQSDQDIAVYLHVGDLGTLSNRQYTLPPIDQWSNAYYSPVSMTDTTPVNIFLFNPNASSLTISYDTLDSAGDKQTNTIDIAANSSGFITMPSSAAYIYTVGGEDFYALGTSDDNASSEWGFNLAPIEQLSSEFNFAWAPGSYNPALTENPIWITPTDDTQLFIDSATVDVYGMNNDGSTYTLTGTSIDADTTRFEIDRLRTYRILDTSDNDQSGLKIYTQDGTTLAAAWGVDPSVGNSLNAGYGFISHPDFEIYETVREVSPSTIAGASDGDNLIELSEQLEYTLTVSNELLADLFEIELSDSLPSSSIASYVPGSTVISIYESDGSLRSSQSIDDGPGDSFPLTGSYTVSDTNENIFGNQGLSTGERIEISYRLLVRDDVNSDILNANFDIGSTIRLDGEDSSNVAIDSITTNSLFTLSVPSDVPAVIIPDQNDSESGVLSAPEIGNSVVGSFSIFPLGDVSQLAINTTNIVSAAELANLSTTPIEIDTDEGEITLTDFDAVTGVVDFSYHASGDSKDHSGGEIIDTINIEVTDSTPASANADLLILIVDSEPTVNADSTSINNNNTSIGGDVFTDIGGADDIGVDTPGSLIGVAAGVTGSAQELPSSLSTPVAGSYGDLTINSSGSFLYELDRNNFTVNSIPLGNSIQDVFTYSVRDNDGSESFTTLTVTINGVVSQSSISIPDNNALNTGEENVLEGSSLIDNTFTISPVGGIDHLEFNDTRVVSSIELANASSTPIDVSTSQGTLRITDYNNTSGVVTYNYVLSASELDHTVGEIVDSIKIAVVNTANYSTFDNLDILILDTAPTAISDEASINNVNTTVNGNVISDPLTGDNISADTPTEISGVAAGNTLSALEDPSTLGNVITGQYGSLVLNGDGSYEYTLDQNNLAVNSLPLGAEITDTFTYTLKDSDDSESYTTLEVTITGAVEPSSITIVDNTAAFIGQESLYEGENLLARSITIAPVADIVNVTFDDTQVYTISDLNNVSTTPIVIVSSRGELTITAFDAASGEITYNYDLRESTEDHSMGSVIDSIKIEVLNTANNRAEENLEIAVLDTAPALNDDAVSMGNNEQNLLGNVITDPAGADTINLDTPVEIIGLERGNVSFSLNDSSTVNNAIVGNYGSITISENGSYQYQLDQENTIIQNLGLGVIVNEVFTYSVSDNDGSEQRATLTIAIEGIVEPPSIDIPDNNNTASGNESIVEDVAHINSEFTVYPIGQLAEVVFDSNQTVTLASLNNLSNSPVVINSDLGQLRLTNYNSATGVVSYEYSPNESRQTHGSLESINRIEIIDQVEITAVNSLGSSVSDQLEIIYIDTEPQASNDTITISNASENVSGNLVTNADYRDDNSADGVLEVIGVAQGDTQQNINDAATVNSILSGTYGQLTVASDGSFNYELNRTLTEVINLDFGTSLQDTFTYTISDEDGSVSRASVEIVIEGSVEAPLIIISNQNGPVIGDLSVAEDQNINANDIRVLPIDGIAQITINSTVVDINQLNDLDNNPVTIDTSLGQLELTSFDSSTGQLIYDFIPEQTQFDHTSGSITESIRVTATNIAGATTENTLDINIADTSPEANNDILSIDNTESRLTVDSLQGLLANDSINVDSPVQLVGVVIGESDQALNDPSTLNSDLEGEYGVIRVNSDSSLTYSLDRQNPNVNSLAVNEIATEIFTYSIIDTDGSIHQAQIIINIRGAVEAPAISIPDSNAESAGDESVYENEQLSDRVFTISPVDGLESLTINNAISLTAEQLVLLNQFPFEITTQYGVLTLMSFDNTTGAVAYNYSLNDANQDHSNGDILDRIDFSLTNTANRSIEDTLDILILDTLPEASFENRTIERLVVGNEIEGQLEPIVASADGVAVVVGVAAGNNTENIIDARTVGNVVHGDYGTFEIQQDGSYTYNMNNSLPEVKLLRFGESLVDEFSYTITDSDGSLSTQIVSIVIAGTPVSNNYVVDTKAIGNEVGTVIVKNEFNDLFATESQSNIHQSKLQFNDHSEPHRHLTELVSTDQSAFYEAGDVSKAHIQHENEIKQQCQVFWLRQLSLDAAKKMNNDGIGLDLQPDNESDNNTQTSQSRLHVINEIPDQTFLSGSSIEFKIPSNIFSNTNIVASGGPNPDVKLLLTMADGGTLPEWLQFNSDSGLLSGSVPEQSDQELNLKVIGVGSNGETAETLLKIDIKQYEELKIPEFVKGKASFNEQLKESSTP